MSFVKVSEYLLFLKHFGFGQQLLKKAYSTMQRLHQDWEAREDRGPRSEALKACGPLIKEAVLSMAASYLPFLEGKVLEQIHSAAPGLIPSWDYALVLNDQQNIHALLSQGDSQLSRLLSESAAHYQSHGCAQGMLVVQHLRKALEHAQCVNQKMALALKKIQAALDKIPPSPDLKEIRSFGALMQQLKAEPNLGRRGGLA
ncbi:MAG: hypothetical protein KA508_06775 [Gammaproteobacteria bacterium]|nr:hypothetical protein [Gammaproteobacteria bacterium]